MDIHFGALATVSLNLLNCGDKMRIFYAVTFTDETKDALVSYRDLIANNSIKGRFTERGNFHLTIEFIGQVSAGDLEEHMNVLEALTITPFDLTASFIGSFKKRDREIVWMGLEKNKILNELQKQVCTTLVEHGFDVENRKYRPHITLGRQVLMTGGLDELIIEPLFIKPYSVALMESKRVGDRLVYEPLAELLL